MIDSNGEYINGYIERKSNGAFEGKVSIEGIDLSPIAAVMFEDDGKNYLWLKRKDMLVYDAEQQRYLTRKREPQWEAYLEKQMQNNTVEYKGEFFFMCLRFSIVGVWDRILGKDKSRMNFFIERLPMSQQNIINGITRQNNKDE
jgi:hypothetical protein